MSKLTAARLPDELNERLMALAKRIRDYLRQRIETLDHPRQLGKALKGQLAELWRYRVGDYRLVCELRDEVLVVLVIRIVYRKAVYK